MFGGETLFINIYKGEREGGWIALEENQPGQIVSVALQPGAKGIAIRHGAYLASTSNISLKTIYTGLSGYFKGKGIGVTIAKVEPNDEPGRVYFHTSTGTVKKFQLSVKDKPLILDNNNILAYTEDLQNTIKKVGGIKSLFFFGEGLACEFKGDGIVYVGSGVESDRSSNVLHTCLKTATEEISGWVGKAVFVISVGGLGYYLVPNSIKQEFLPVLWAGLKRNFLKN